jgi:hypothetical protein
MVGSIRQLALVETYTDPITGFIKVSDSFPITPSFGAVWYRNINFGFPDIRESSQENPQADGVYDETRFTGGRVVTIEGVIIGGAFGDDPAYNNWPTDVPWNSSSWYASQLSAWAAPGRRFRLYWTDETDRHRFMDVRGGGFVSDVVKNASEVREFQLTLVNPSGRIYTFGGGTGSPGAGVGTTPDGRWDVPIALFEDPDFGGRSYPRDAPFSHYYPGVIDSGNFPGIKYNGTAPTPCVIEITFGQDSASPQIIVDVTAPDGTVGSVGLHPSIGSLSTGTILKIDTGTRTMTYQVADSFPINITQFLAAPLQWPQLKPGINRQDNGSPKGVRGYNGVSISTTFGATVRIRYYEADLV